MDLIGNLSEFVSSPMSSGLQPPLESHHWPPGYQVLMGNVVPNDSIGCNGSKGGNFSLLSHRCVTRVEKLDPVEKNWVALLILLAVIVTVMGNILVIMAVTLERKLQNATNYFLMSLAITDMLLGLLVMPVAMVTILYDYNWPLPVALCPVWIFLDVLFSTASIMHLCAISLDRYIAIRNPIRHSRSNSRTKARAKIAAAWTISVGISMPIPVLGLRDHSKVFQDDSCQLTDDSFVLIGSFVAFFIPLIIMVVTYFLTISALQSEVTLCLDQLVPRPKWPSSLGFLSHGSFSSERVFSRRSLIRNGDGVVVTATGVASPPRAFGRRTMQSISNERKASKVLGIVFLLFITMWCPFFVTNVLMVVCGSAACDRPLLAGLLNVFVWVGYLSSAVNPLVYTLFNKTYRAAFARYVRCRYREQRRPLQLILVNTIPPLAYRSSRLTPSPDGESRAAVDGSAGASTDAFGNHRNRQARGEGVTHV